MFKKLILFSLTASLLTSCISISVDAQATAKANFVTATLLPTKPGFVPITPTLAPQPTEASVVTTSALTPSTTCKDSAILLQDVTILDNTQMKAGESFTKTWQLQNKGTCTWSNYTIRFASGDQMNAPSSTRLQNVLPDEKLNISVDLVAPTANGIYTGYFTLNDANGNSLLIGTEKTFWVKIVVGNILPTLQATAQSSVINTFFVPKGGNSNCAYSQNAGYVGQLIDLISQARASAGLPALSINTQLSAAALTHSADMACNNFLDHTGSDGSWIRDRLVQAGYNATSFMEIIAIGTPQNAMSQWQADQPHWDVILNPNALEFGVGYAYYANSDFGGYITVDFGG